MTDVEAQDMSGSWLVEWIAERPVVDYSLASLTFGEEGRLSGNASCNLIMATYTVDGDQLTIGPARVTRKLCPPALMDQEQRFLAALEDVVRAEIRNELLYLYSADARELLWASRQR
jgi:heat shock protein HslJ